MYKRDVQISAQKEENQAKLIKLGVKWKLAAKGHSRVCLWD